MFPVLNFVIGYIYNHTFLYTKISFSISKWHSECRPLLNMGVLAIACTAIHIYMIIILAVVVFLSGAQLMNPVYGFAIYKISLS